MNVFLRLGAYLLHPLLMPVLGTLIYYLITPRFVEPEIKVTKLFAVAIITFFIPVITFFPFSLVGAIGSLAALDYLGFGLPPPTPSWGELLAQAQQYRWAWWLILYPSLALFIVMLLGVFIGEGIRNAYDPKRFTRLE